MSNVWNRFAGIATATEVNAEKEKFTPLPIGKFKAELISMIPAENKDGLPMVKGSFRLDTGRMAYVNQNLQNINYPNMTAVNTAKVVAMIESIKGESIDFTNVEDLADTILGLEMGGNFTLDISYGAKDTECKYPNIVIISDETDLPEPLTDDDIPF